MRQHRRFVEGGDFEEKNREEQRKNREIYPIAH